jgi:hypothetical protein
MSFVSRYAMAGVFLLASVVAVRAEADVVINGTRVIYGVNNGSSWPIGANPPQPGASQPEQINAGGHYNNSSMQGFTGTDLWGYERSDSPKTGVLQTGPKNVGSQYNNPVWRHDTAANSSGNMAPKQANNVH